MGAGGNINVRAFIEGVEIPVTECSTTETVWGIARATVNVPYHRLGRDILERSLFHAFYYDTDGFDFVRQEAVGDDPAATFSEDAAGFGRYRTSDERRMKLLFWGEISGFSRAISTKSNMLSYNAVGFSNYFDTIKQFQAVRGAGSVSDTERRFAGIEDAFTTGRSGRYGTANSLIQILREGGDNFQESIKELLTEFIVRTNEFYKSRATILRLKDIVRAVGQDETVESLVDLSVFRRFMRQTISSGGQQMTIRSILQTLSQYLFHDLVEHATPSYFSFVSEDTHNNLNNDAFDDSEPVVQREDQADITAGIVYKPELWWAAPPACNILFPEHYSSVQEQIMPLTEPTRTILKIQPGVSGHRRTITDNFFAPDTAALNSIAQDVPLSEQHVFLLPHERFRGINANFVYLNEIARLTRNSDYRDYMRSYAQFQHWKAAYGSRRLSVRSGRHLPQVLVGYPAVLVDPNTRSEASFDSVTRDERLRLARLLAALRACLRRLRARLAAILSKIERAKTIEDYYTWLYLVEEDWEHCLDDILIEGDAVDHTLGDDNTPWGLWDADADLHVDGVPAYNDDNYVSPEPDVALMEEIRGDGHNPFIPDSRRWVHYHPRSRYFKADIDFQMVLLREQVEAWEREAASLRARIARVQGAIDEILRYLRTLGYEDRPVEHILFYVESKAITLRNGSNQGTSSTTLNGSYVRLHDEDIDLDGNRGDSFDNIIKTGVGGFFSDIYDSENIGDEFYRPIYGVGSLIDVGARMQALISQHGRTEEEVSESVQRSEDEIRWQSIVEDICNRELEDTTGTEGFDIEMALDAISEAYRSFGDIGYDMERFVSSIVARPIATMVDIFGAGELTENHSRAEYGNHSGSGKPAGVGFHEFAFIQDGDGAETFDTTGLESGESDQLDVATARRDRALAYANAIKARAGRRS